MPAAGWQFKSASHGSTSSVDMQAERVHQRQASSAGRTSMLKCLRISSGVLPAGRAVASGWQLCQLGLDESASSKPGESRKESWCNSESAGSAASSWRTLDHVGHREAGQVQQALDVQVVGSLRAGSVSVRLRPEAALKLAAPG